ncbi:MAG: hypothetical protein LWW88_12930 [Acinetobacter sp.]|uniref:hypothetical protein n=1 Tax=Acinetobacter sp. TaxID=472 RepID=UPI00258D60BB|nr:hypothetical protein [Acinetobacter sp.]MCE1272431.1 hypothetical protein [Acinetobacter sp.]
MATLTQILTTRKAVIDNFTARVVADGGQIVSSTKLESAVNFLFDNNLYGRMGVCASPHYAVKLDGAGGVEKLYSIDGQDLVGLTLNGGTLPKLTVDNFVNFNEAVAADTVGGILTTATKQAWSKTGRFGVAIATKEHVNSAINPIFSMSTHGETSLNVDVFSIHSNTANAGTASTRINNAGYGGGNVPLTIVTINNSKNGALMYSYDKYKQRTAFWIHGIFQAENKPLNAPSELYEREHYLDFGGTSRASAKVVSGVKMSAMWFMKDLCDAQAIAINKFQEAEYL